MLDASTGLFIPQKRPFSAIKTSLGRRPAPEFVGSGGFYSI
jgi:hypothetical protein